MIALHAEAEKRIREEGERAWPNECCGFLFGALEGGEKRADAVLAVENAREAGEQYHRFVITPEDVMQAEREARRQKKDILGIYHSHPDHPAKPSDYDREQALPFYSYVIVAVQGGKAADLTSWELTGARDQFLEEKVTLWR
ncbi:MAG: M67 family metallopeptidase [Spirochaetaceae bacterium]|jgi:proteasome lid subunit RPN8/RPN11|nr:M67 family metallopeptidase [Spirochaetaceae bacterium]